MTYLSPRTNQLSRDQMSTDQLSPAELLSLMADGRLSAKDDAAWAKALQAPELLSQWQSNQLIGDLLRQHTPAARGTRAQSQWMTGLRDCLAQEPQHGAVVISAVVPVAAPAFASPPSDRHIQTKQTQPASNDRFWKLVAGASSVLGLGAIAVAIGFTQNPPGQSAQTSSLKTQNRDAADSQAVQFVTVGDGTGVMIRDARLMERMSQHRQFGGTGVHASTAFIRNATFEQVRCASTLPGAAAADC
jgi:negative regulator of sigma E activity